jgi:integrase
MACGGKGSKYSKCSTGVSSSSFGAGLRPSEPGRVRTCRLILASPPTALLPERRLGNSLREAKQAKVNLGPITKGNLFKVIRNYVWAPILRRAGLRYRKPHALRHTYASLLIEGGESLEYVQEQLGHHSPAFTLAVYGHLIPRGDRRAVDRWTTHPPAIPRNQAARVWVVSELAL